MAEAIPYGAASNMLTRLGSSLFQEIGLIYGVANDLKKLENTLTTINAAMLDSEERQDKSRLMQDWVRKLKSVIYDADDVLDAFAAKALVHRLETPQRKRDKVCKFFSPVNQVAFRYKMAVKIKEIREKLHEIAADMTRFNFRETVIQPRVLINREKEQTHSFVLTSEIIGREKNKEEIIQLLMCSSSQVNVSVISIVGIGGLGKTTLAQLVYNDRRVMNFFEQRMWVCVSENFDVKTLVEKILKSIKNCEVRSLEMDQLQIELRQHLDGKRFMLVLDDVWNENHERWFNLKNLLMGGAPGSKIVVTTRSRRVASVMGAESPYILEGLTEDYSWDLFEQLAFGARQEMVLPSLINIGKEIVSQCGGVPLALRTIGSLMQSKSEESEWLSILENEIWALPQDDNGILPVLKFSCTNLPVHLRQCFAYCSLFPKDSRIDKEMLIQLWIAQGYVQSSRASEIERIADQYFKDLLFGSLFQEVENDEFDQFGSCKMHDLIHDLAQAVAGTDFFVVDIDAVNISGNIRHVSFECSLNETEFPRFLSEAKGLRTLLNARCWVAQNEIHLKKLFSNFRRLRALDLSLSSIEALPDSIGKLQHLRYLDLSSNYKLERLPNAVCNLHNLQTMKLSSCQLLKSLPEDIGKLINLLYLMIDGCNNLTHMPVGLGKLTSLQKFPIFCAARQNSSSSRIATLNELNGLNHLRAGLCLQNLEAVMDPALESGEANLKQKKSLQSLTLKWTKGRRDSKLLLKNLRPHPNLKELRVEGYGGIRFSSWLSSISNLVVLTIMGCERCKYLPALDQLPCLKFLKLESLNALQYIDHDGGQHFSSSSALPEASSAAFFLSLEELILLNLPKLVGWWRKEENEVVNHAGTSATVAHQQHCQHLFPCSPKLTIEGCSEFTFMPLLPYFQKLKLVRSSSEILQQQTLVMTASKLESLDIVWAQLVSFPEEWLRRLASLKSLGIEKCLRLKSLSLGLQHLTVLQRLTLLDCLELDLCDADDGIQWKYLSSLHSLVIENVSKLASLPEGLQHVTTLQILSICSCNNLISLPAWIGNLTSLQEITLWGCGSLTSLPEGMRSLTSLQKLTIVNCSNYLEDVRRIWVKIGQRLLMFHISMFGKEKFELEADINSILVVVS